MPAKLNLPSGLVTFLFTDIEGSTRLAQLLGAEYRPVLAEHRRILRRALGAADGVALFTEGDSVFSAFGDASAAMRACAEAQRALDAHAWPRPEARPRVRMGMHSGYAEPVSGEYATPEVHRAARVASAAHGGQVLCSGATARLATDLPEGAELVDLGLYQLRGFDGRERLFQFVADGLERDFPRPRTFAAAPHNLPSPVRQLRRPRGRVRGAARPARQQPPGERGRTRWSGQDPAGARGRGRQRRDLCRRRVVRGSRGALRPVPGGGLDRRGARRAPGARPPDPGDAGRLRRGPQCAAHARHL